MYAKNQEVSIKIDATHDKMPLDLMVQLGIMANELLTNSIKYAFKDDVGIISIELHNNNGIYSFIYSDNGIGVEDIESLQKGKSLGVKLIYLAAKKLKGKVSISSERGLKYKVEFKDA